MRPVILLFVLSLAVASTSQAQTCAPGDATRAAILPLGLQNKLLAHKIAPDDFELDAPPTVGADIVMLRKTLDVATQAFFRCEAGNTTEPKALQSKLAAFLHADRSKREVNSSAQDGVYGANLNVHIESARGLPDSLFIVLRFGIQCGDDSLLFLFTKSEGKWHQSLHWYSNKYTKPSDAFGDLYEYSSVPGQDGTPLVAIAHGHPWCTSRWSGFDIHLLRPATKLTSQVMLGHFSTGYDRSSEQSQGIKPTADGFTFKFWTNEAVPEKDPTQMSGPLTISHDSKHP